MMLVTMSNKELHRLPVIQAFVEKHLHRSDAASQWDLTERQVQHLVMSLFNHLEMSLFGIKALSFVAATGTEKCW